ncbi:MAG: bifunctional 3-deoxy-7-phosphoheptulonate synthase/chorismate mutase type II, partial [Bacteroidales bacterium]|nr:bifunctional 3-deoxy-7-phosphoheptulonate synthase/chorismate mutase type II [Bacteroidales bacterium]
LGVIHRGFSSFQKIQYRNDPGWRIAIELRTRYPGLPFFADPSHMGGDRKYLLELSQRALDLGLDGLMIESHCNPSCALSDASQQVTPEAMQDFLGKIVVRDNEVEDSDFNENLSQLRTRIDVIDDEILSMLASRMSVSRRIGEYKKAHNVAILQTGRWDSVLQEMIEEGKKKGLSPEFISSVYNAIHEASVQVQNEVLSSDGSPSAN